MRTCVACNYRRKPADKISIHLFPKNEQRRQLWIAAIGQENYKPSKRNALCSQHFEKNCFFYPSGGEKKKIHMKPDAVPTIFGFYCPRGKASNINRNSEEIQIDMEVTSNTVDNAAVEQGTIVKHDTANETPSTFNADDSVENNQSHMEIAPDNSNADRCNEGDPQMNVGLFDSSLQKYQRRWRPRYFGDCSEKELESPQAKRIWQVAKETINDQKRKIIRLQRQVQRQKSKIRDMKSLIVELKQKQMISDQAEKMLSVRN